MYTKYIDVHIVHVHTSSDLKLTLLSSNPLSILKQNDIQWDCNSVLAVQYHSLLADTLWNKSI